MWVVNADGSRLRRVAIVPAAHNLTWSADGRSLLVSTFANEDGDLYTASVDGSSLNRTAKHATFAQWTSDGDRLYYLVKAGTPARSSWRLAQGRIHGGRLELRRYVTELNEYQYDYFGLSVGPCA
ncbi:MAG: hypothetical protein JWN46_4042 [Acidimicrobiales bacterium]|nr:hypothetical protein [Acidimicrobiales bacterium]